jgi:hypothetical protein
VAPVTATAGADDFAGAVGAAAGGASSFSVTISLWNLVITSMIMLLLRWLSGWPGNFFIKLKHGTEG